MPSYILLKEFLLSFTLSSNCWTLFLSTHQLIQITLLSTWFVSIPTSNNWKLCASMDVFVELSLEFFVQAVLYISQSTLTSTGWWCNLSSRNFMIFYYSQWYAYFLRKALVVFSRYGKNYFLALSPSCAQLLFNHLRAYEQEYYRVQINKILCWRKSGWDEYQDTGQPIGPGQPNRSRQPKEPKSMVQRKFDVNCILIVSNVFSFLAPRLIA